MLRVTILAIMTGLIGINCGDSEAPYVAINNPIHGAKVSGTVTVSAIAIDNQGIERVDFFIDDSLVATADLEPYRYLWNTDGLVDSSFHSLYAEAFDRSGNSDVSAMITVYIGSC